MGTVGAGTGLPGGTGIIRAREERVKTSETGESVLKHGRILLYSPPAAHHSVTSSTSAVSGERRDSPQSPGAPGITTVREVPERFAGRASSRVVHLSVGHSRRDERDPGGGGQVEMGFRDAVAPQRGLREPLRDFLTDFVAAAAIARTEVDMDAFGTAAGPLAHGSQRLPLQPVQNARRISPRSHR